MRTEEREAAELWLQKQHKQLEAETREEIARLEAEEAAKRSEFWPK
jgi:hypothetical protein